MDTEEKVLQEYIVYAQHKEKFVERSFNNNKFYLVVNLAVLFFTVPMKFIPFSFGVMFTTLFSFIGILLCILWYINIDSYELLLKIKLKDVLEKLEDNLPVKPYQMEHEAIQNARKNKKNFLFVDIQKSLSIVLLIAFIAIFLNELLMFII